MSSAVIDCSPYRSELLALTSELPRIPRTDINSFFNIGTQLAEQLPRPLREILNDFNINGNVDGYLLLRGLPVEDDDDLPTTPSAGAAEVNRPLLNMEGMLNIIGGALGLLTAYDQGYGNRRSINVLHELFPTPQPHPLSGSTSSTQLQYHTDLSHHARQPNYILLSASRGDHEGKAATLVCSIRKALPLLAPEVRDYLFDRVFECIFDTDQPDSLAYVKALYGDKDDPYLSYNRSLMKAQTDDDIAALDALLTALEKVVDRVVLRGGDLLIIDNFRVAHGRAPFTARWDGKDRWLHRAYVRTDRGSQRTGDDRVGEILPFLARI